LATFPKSSLFNLKKLANLHLNRNQIDSLPVRVFEFSPLSEVNLMWNKIRLINDQIFHASSTQKLRWMSLANNKIEEIGSNAFESLPHLTHLELQGNRLSHINPQTFNSLPKLKELNLERNDISILHDLSFNQLPLLSRLNLAHNKIANISESVFQNITRLEHLILSHNKLTHFDFLFLDNQVTNLAALDVSFNKLTR
jgi:Leucine-rich repeat (LRR) protein